MYHNGVILSEKQPFVTLLIPVGCILIGQHPLPSIYLIYTSIYSVYLLGKQALQLHIRLEQVALLRVEYKQCSPNTLLELAANAFCFRLRVCIIIPVLE